MSKSRRNRRPNILKNIKNTSSKALPLVEKGLTNVGTAAKVVAQKSKPVLEKGVSAVYGTLATGFDLGAKGAKNVVSGVKNITKKRRGKKSGRKHGKKSHRRH
jgi:hypothetical protein